MFREEYAAVFAGDERWQGLSIPSGDCYEWNSSSTYVQNPPFFQELPEQPSADDRHSRRPRTGARRATP